MIDRAQLLTDLQALLRKLEADLLERSSDVAEVEEALRSDYEQAKDAERTAQSYEEWRSDAITQMASAWVLSGVFVRFLEDNQLIDPPVIAGLGERLQRARDEHELYFRQHPQDTDRDYWLMVFDRLAKLPGAKEIFGANNRIRELPNWLSGDAAGELLRFFQRVEPGTGRLAHDFTDENWDTRFLGDLYQDLSEAARKKYALLQTPEFVESFILDRTLEPALNEFQLEFQRQEFRMIDPACGSGHFLLGSFHRLLDRWIKKEPATSIGELVLRSLSSVHGVDINPYAVAIARFRLLLAAMRASGIERLRDAPAFQIQVVCGDSLLHGEGSQLLLGDWAPMAHHFYGEDVAELNRILVPGEYHAVVANPPYITVKDRALNSEYRRRYKTCHMKYSLAAPFSERIFQLAVNRGFTGQITTNSFMKREFGKKLIEEFFPKVDLTYVINTSGAYIPGHATPTVILFGRNCKPVASTIRAVLGIRGEPTTPDDPAHGLVWSAILTQVDQVNSKSDFVSVADVSRDLLRKHPWSMGGGGAAELREQLEQECSSRLGDFSTSIGFASFPGLDDAFVMDFSSLLRRQTPSVYIKPFVSGEAVRDFCIERDMYALAPYSRNFCLVPYDAEESWARHLWYLRTTLEGVVSFGGKTRRELGNNWWGWYRWVVDKYSVPLSLTFAFVASHNHFSLDRGGKTFNRSAPVIKLPTNATEDEHLALLGLLNSSIICFWMKQVSQQKQLTAGDSVRIETIAKVPYEFAGTQLQKLPLPPKWNTSSLRICLLELAQKADQLSQKLSERTPLASIKQGLRAQKDLRFVWKQFLQEQEKIRSQLVMVQEEIDFVCYHFYGLTDNSLLGSVYLLDGSILGAGDRPFCILRQDNQEGFSVPSEIPTDWPQELQNLWRRRIDAIQESSFLQILEDPHYKRRWIGQQGKFNHLRTDDELKDAAKEWLLDRLESCFDFDGRMNEEGKPTSKLEISLVSIAQLADIARHNPEFLRVGELYRKDAAFDVLKLVAELVEAESVPLLPVLRYKPSGLRKRAEWEHTWSLQRLEDAIDARTKLPKGHPDYVPESAAQWLKQQEIGDIPVPPKYTSSDFQKSHYWKLRGKLDVPKERWVSFPYCNAEDGTVMIAWAGYNHLQLAQAISTYFITVKEELGGRNDLRLPPLLASLVELLPWLKQWHNDRDPTYNLVMSDYFESFIQDEARDMGKTLDEVSAWQLPAKTGRRRT